MLRNCTNDTDVSVPTAEDNCVGTVTSTGGTRDDSGSLNDPWPLGTTTITWTFTDGTNSTTCTQTVVVTDDDAPACPTLAQVDLTTDVPTCTNDTDVSVPTAEDNCVGTVTSTGGTRSDSNPLNDPWPLGPTTITWTFTDGTNSTTCTQSVVVTDDDAPTITTCPITRNISGCDVSAISGPVYSAITAPSTYAEFSSANNQGDASDNCGIITSVSYVDAPPSGICLIELIRTWTISDGTNSTSCNQTINVNAPAVVLNCPSDINLACQDQSSINIAFNNWLNSFGFSGGCNGSWSFDGGIPMAPNCGGSVTVTYRVASDCESDATCMRTFSVTFIPIEIHILDPCTCLDNATTLTDGQFSETIEVTGPTGETWTVVTAPGLYQMASPSPPAAPLPISVGTVLVEGPAGVYTLTGKHIDALGYSISVTNGSVTLSTSNTCYYPNPSLSGLDDVYCSQSGPQTVTVTAQLGDGSGPVTGESILFELIRQSDNSTVATQSDGTNTFDFDPALLAQGHYTLRVTFDAAGDPGCAQPIEAEFEVRNRMWGVSVGRKLIRRG
ncbi:MAG: hypothetical protein IPJ40_07990 [Saprospirales bacterium]|nr:hypothetical protein [Saprospirales bacterium]